MTSKKKKHGKAAIEVLTVNLADIKLNPDNPRQITEKDLERLVKSLQDFPEMMNLREIVIDENMMVLGGNMRVRALQKIGVKECTAKIVKGLTPEQKREFVIKDNAMFGEWDFDALANAWGDLPLVEWGVKVPEDWLATSPGEPADAEPQIDKAAELNKVWQVKTGDLFQIAFHRLLCGDSTKADDVARVMGGEKAQLIHADPPYGMGKEKDGVQNDNLYAEKLDAFQMAWWRAARPHTADNGSAYIWGNAEDLWRLWYRGGLKDSERLTLRNEITWDKREDNPTMLVSGVPLESRRMYHPTERCLFFMLGEQGFNNNADNYWEGWEPIRSYLDGERVKSGLTTAQCNEICGKQNMTQAAFTRGGFRLILKEDYEKLRAACKGKAFKREHDDIKREHDDIKREHDDLKREFYATRAYFDNTHDNMTDVWEFPRVTGADRHGHATPKPVAMISRAVKSSTPDAGLVYEPFLGSGTTMVAAQNLGRKCYGIEISSAYCAVILQRMTDAFPGIEIRRST